MGTAKRAAGPGPVQCRWYGAGRRGFWERAIATRAGRAPPADPADHAHIPGTVAVHVLHDSGASLTAAVPLSRIGELAREQRIVRAGITAAGLRDVRDSIRTGLADELVRGAHLRQTDAKRMIGCAVWLASTAPDPEGAVVRERLQQDCRLVLALTTHSVHGLPAINGRTMLADPEATLPEILAMAGMGPSTAEVTRQLAPH
jgi:hypothetical protein